MHEELVARVRYHIEKAKFCGLENHEATQLLKEAADAIEELRRENELIKMDFESADSAYVALLPLIPRWIPVMERLPGIDTTVLLFDPEEGDCLLAQLTVTSEDEDGKNYWWVDKDENLVPFEAYTHWMPISLPEPPKEETL